MSNENTASRHQRPKLEEFRASVVAFLTDFEPVDAPAFFERTRYIRLEEKFPYILQFAREFFDEFSDPLVSQLLRRRPRTIGACILWMAGRGFGLSKSHLLEMTSPETTTNFEYNLDVVTSLCRQEGLPLPVERSGYLSQLHFQVVDDAWHLIPDRDLPVIVENLASIHIPYEVYVWAQSVLDWMEYEYLQYAERRGHFERTVVKPASHKATYCNMIRHALEARPEMGSIPAQNQWYLRGLLSRAVQEGVIPHVPVERLRQQFEEFFPHWTGANVIVLTRKVYTFLRERAPDLHYATLAGWIGDLPEGARQALRDVATILSNMVKTPTPTLLIVDLQYFVAQSPVSRVRGGREPALASLARLKTLLRREVPRQVLVTLPITLHDLVGGLQEVPEEVVRWQFVDTRIQPGGVHLQLPVDATRYIVEHEGDLERVVLVGVYEDYRDIFEVARKFDLQCILFAYEPETLPMSLREAADSVDLLL